MFRGSKPARWISGGLGEGSLVVSRWVGGEYLFVLPSFLAYGLCLGTVRCCCFGGIGGILRYQVEVNAYEDVSDEEYDEDFE